jgi:hypothetical protein
MEIRAFFAIIYTRQLKRRGNARNITIAIDVKCHLAPKKTPFVTGADVERAVEIEYYIL